MDPQARPFAKKEVSVWGVRTDTDPHVGYDWKTSQWIFQVPVKGGIGSI